MKKFLTILLFGFLSLNSWAGSCDWEEGTPMHNIIHKKFQETSSLQALDRGCGSMKEPVFYLAEDGPVRRIYKNQKKVKIAGLAINGDLEDMSQGPCPSGEKQCLYLAYIGNNKIFLLGQIYRKLKIAIVELESKKLLKVIHLRYKNRGGNGSHVADAEAFSVHPKTGDFTLVTKFPPSRVYRLKREDILGGKEKIKLMEYLGYLDFSKHPAIASIKKKSRRESAQKITGMDISPDGEKFVLVSYGKAFEFDIDLSRVPLGSKEKKPLEWNYRISDLKKLPQTEAVSYIDCGSGIAYASERNKKKKSDSIAHLVHTLKCRRK